MTVLKVGGQRLALCIEGVITQHSSASPPTLELDRQTAVISVYQYSQQCRMIHEK